MITVTRTYRYRLYPTRRQAAALEQQLSFCCDIYNAALEQRRTAWTQNRKTVRLYDQIREIPPLRAAGLAPEGMNAELMRDPLHRVNRAYQEFFRRRQAGQKAGLPRFRGRSRYDTMAFVFGDGAHIREGRLTLQAIGAVKVKWHRDLPDDAEIRLVSVNRSAGRWHVCLILKTAPAELPRTGEIVGLDMGVSTFATLSTGERMEGPRAGREAISARRRSQRRFARRQPGSARRRKALALLLRHYEHVANVRRDHAHKLSHEIVQRFDLIAVEKLQIRNMVRGRPLAREINDQAWGIFLRTLAYKAADAGRQVIEVNPRGTSQECSDCGAIVPKTLAERTHSCACGLVLDRDVNAARNVLNRALERRVQASTWEEVTPCVA